MALFQDGEDVVGDLGARYPGGELAVEREIVEGEGELLGGREAGEEDQAGEEFHKWKLMNAADRSSGFLNRSAGKVFGAIEGTRTPTPLRVRGPEPRASANSATMAQTSIVQGRGLGR